MNEQIDIDVKKLKPLTRFIYTIGELPTSYLMSMTYQEQLIWLCNYLTQTVIPTINTNAAAVEEVQQIVMDLQDYINNYFDNLDVQDEVDHKIDEMVEDGTLGNIIESYINPYFVEVNNELNEYKDGINNEMTSFKNIVNTELEQQNARLDAVISNNPIPVSDVSDMTDTTKIYVNTTDGYWYYYDGTNWTQGGLYQSSGISDNAITYPKLSSNLRNMLSFETLNSSLQFGWEQGPINDSTGYPVNNTGNYYYPISIRTANFLDLDKHYFEMFKATNYWVTLYFYKDDNTFIGLYDGMSDFTTTEKFINVNSIYSNAKKYKIMLRQRTSIASTFSPSDYDPSQFYMNLAINSDARYSLKDTTNTINNMQSLINDNLFRKIDIYSDIEWIIGGVNTSTHALTTETDRFRNKTVIYAKKGSYLTLTDNVNYNWKICKYKYICSNNLEYIGDVGTTGLSPDPIKIIDEDCFITIVMAKEPRSTLDPTEIPTMLAEIEGKVYTEDLQDKLNTELFDADDNTDGAYWDTDGKFKIGTSTDGFNVASRPYYVKPGQLIKVRDKTNRLSNNLGIFLDENYNLISSWLHGKVHSQKVPQNAKFMCLSFFDQHDYNVEITEVDNEFPENNYRIVFDEPRVKLVAHSGLDGVAPEATIPAYTLAGQAGMWGCKIDICETSDGYFVCSHDATVDRMFDGTGTIAELTLAQIQAMTVDSGINISQYHDLKIVQLYEALEICKRYDMHPYIEFKHLLSRDSVANVISIIRKYGLLETTLCQCSDGNKEYLYALREITDMIPISYWLVNMNIDDNIGYVNYLGNAFLSLNAGAGHEVDQFETYAGDIKALHMPLCGAAISKGGLNTYVKRWIKDYGLDILVTYNITYADLDY